MRGAARALTLLLLTVWVGGEVFFAFVVAPVAFGVLPSTHEAGLVVGGTLRVLHWIGLVSGAAVLLLALVGRLRRERWVIFAVAAMMLVTAVSQFVVLPRMDRDRDAAGGTIARGTDPHGSGPAAEFERLHVWSERMEGLVLLLGVGVVLTMAPAGRDWLTAR